MAKKGTLTGYFAIDNSGGTPVDLTTRVKSITINTSGETLDVTTLNSAGRERIAGLKDYSLDVTFTQDYAATNVDATLSGIVGGSAGTFSWRPTSAVQSATNPTYSGEVICTSYTPVSSGVGDADEASAHFEGANGSAITRTAT